jgi:hypothetical protein
MQPGRRQERERLARPGVPTSGQEARAPRIRKTLHVPSGLTDDRDQSAQNGGAGGRAQAGVDAAVLARHLYTV